MGSSFGKTDLTAALPYWYERMPYAFQATDLAASGTVPLFSLRGWNGGGSPSTLVTLRRIQVDPWPGVLAQVTVDGQSYQLAVDSLPASGPADPAWAAVTQLTASLTNQSATPLTPAGYTIPTLAGRYEVTVWQMPAMVRLLRGYGLSAADTAYLKALGFGTDPTDQRGWFPVPIAAILERTYANRQIAPPLRFAQPVGVSTAVQPVDTVQAQPNQLLVLRNVAAVAPPEWGVTVSVDRDNDAHHVVLPAAQIGAAGADCFVTATTHLTLNVSATAAPANRTVPVRWEIWTLALSNVLRTRLALLSEAGLQRLLGSASAGTKFYEDVQVGVI